MAHSQGADQRIEALEKQLAEQADRILHLTQQLDSERTLRQQLEGRLHQLDSATEHVQLLLNTIQRQAVELELMEQTRSALSRELDLPTLLQIIVETIANIFAYTHVSLYLLKGNALLLQHQVGYEHTIDRIPIETGVTGRVVRTGESILLEDVTSDPDFLGAVDNLVSELCVPLIDQGEVVGILNIESTDGIRLTLADLHLMEGLSEHINLAIVRARLYTEIRKSEEQFRLLFEFAPVGMGITALDGRLLKVNPALCEVFEYSAEELTQMTIQELTHPDDIAPNMFLREQALRGEIPQFRMEKRFYTKSGRIVWTLLQVVLIRDTKGQPLHFISQTIDVSDLKRVEEELRLLNTELEQRVQTRTADLLATNMRLLELDQIKSKFISDVSHELRTPVATLSTRLYLLERSPAENIPNHLAVLKRHVMRISEMLEDILDFSQIENTQLVDLAFEQINLNSIIEDMILLHRPAAEAAGLQIYVHAAPDLPTIWGRAELLRRALSNLLSNAIKYTPAGQIDLTTSMDTPTDSTQQQVCVAVADTGTGILPEDRPYLFDRFYRGRLVGSTNIAGSGLGLAIVQEIVALHHGQIEVESTPGEGSCFRLRFPTIKSAC